MRLGDWESRLCEYIASVRDKPFAWGEHDCGMNFLNCCEAITGVDPCPDWRGAYKTELGMVRAVKKRGHDTLESLMDSRFEAIHVGMVRRGDGVFNGDAIGICMGSHALFVGQEGDGPDGLIRVPRSEWTKGWRVE